MAINIPTNLLRSFVTIIDSGSMMAASELVFVTQGALSLQIKRLEDMLQQPLFVRDGRRLVLNAAGDTMLAHARRLLDAHDQAVAALAGTSLSGPVRIGMVQDFAETLLTGVLARFVRLHEDAQMFVRVAGTAELQDLIAHGSLDLAIGFAAPDWPDVIRTTPTWWYGATDLLDRDPLPLVVLERPCRFRDAAIAALDRIGRRYRIAVETPNLSTLRSAVLAGIGVTCRPPLFLRDLPALPAEALPALPAVGTMILGGIDQGQAVTRLRELTVEAILEL